MSVFKCTLLFSDATGAGAGGPAGVQHVGGWSESYYNGTSVFSTLLAQLLSPSPGFLGLCPARAALLPNSAAIIGIRVSLVLPKTGSSQTLGNVFPGSSGQTTDVPQMALQCTMPSQTSSNVRRQAIRGVPDADVKFGEYNEEGGFGTNVTNFFNELFLWRFVGQDFTQFENNVLSIDTNGLVTLTGPHNYAPGETIQIKKTHSTFPDEYLSFKRKVESIGPGLNVFKLLGLTGLVTTGGTARRVIYETFAIDSARCAVNRITVRKVGRPFGAYRGRRSKRRVI